MPNEPEGNFLGWDTDEITNPAPEENAANIIPFTLQAEVVITKPERTPTSRVHAQAPPPPQEEVYPWSASEDEAFRLGAFRRSWRGPTRREWNSHPTHSDGKMCKTCGYKWHTMDIMEDGACWNCWMRDNKPDEMKKILAAADRLAGDRGEQKHGETAGPKLVKLDEQKGK